MDRRLTELHVENFRSLRNVTIPLAPINVLVGPNGAGKTNVLEVFHFLADMARTGLGPALAKRGGYRDVVFRGGAKTPQAVRIGLKGTWTPYSTDDALDEYELEFRPMGEVVAYQNTLRFKRTKGPDSRITEDLREQPFVYVGGENPELPEDYRSLLLWLSEPTPRPAVIDGQADPAQFINRLASLRHVEVDPGLEVALSAIRADQDTWKLLVEDARQLLPQLEDIDLGRPPGGDQVQVVLHERGLRRPTPLADASSGTVRVLSLLAMLHDPEPPALTCIDGIDRGIHPQALELLMERIDDASERTQFLITTCAPAFVNLLDANELIVCERAGDGSSTIPAMSVDELTAVLAESQRQRLGDLWFLGNLAGHLWAYDPDGIPGWLR